jgi:hypothetical protein|nr:MAG TPA: protein of unknown function DUF4376 [Siphoviridae sp. ctTYz13]
MYWKKDGKIYNKVILHTIYTYINDDGKSESVKIQKINPTDEELISEGYTKVTDDEFENANENLKDAIKNKLELIDNYANSTAVNELTFKGVKLWLSPEIRANYNVSLDAAQLLKEKNITFSIGNQLVTLSIDEARIILAKVQRYADATFIVSSKHKAEVSKLPTIEEVENYNITEGYPSKLEF